MSNITEEDFKKMFDFISDLHKKYTSAIERENEELKKQLEETQKKLDEAMEKISNNEYQREYIKKIPPSIDRNTPWTPPDPGINPWTTPSIPMWTYQTTTGGTGTLMADSNVNSTNMADEYLKFKEQMLSMHK